MVTAWVSTLARGKKQEMGEITSRERDRIVTKPNPLNSPQDLAIRDQTRREGGGGGTADTKTTNSVPHGAYKKPILCTSRYRGIRNGITFPHWCLAGDDIVRSVSVSGEPV